jgi:hypothetical protein
MIAEQPHGTEGPGEGDEAEPDECGPPAEERRKRAGGASDIARPAASEATNIPTALPRSPGAPVLTSLTPGM